MKVLLDTNVVLSGIFFPSGIPRKVLVAWEQGKFDLIISPEIFDEYNQTVREFRGKVPPIDIDRMLDLILLNSQVCRPEPLSQAVCDDADDDMFIACAISSDVKIIVSGDKHLLDVSGYQNIEVLKPRAFLERYLS